MMKAQGWNAAEVQSLDDRDVPIHYFESLRRRLTPRPRVLRISSDFRCPADVSAGWTLLRGSEYFIARVLLHFTTPGHNI
jgi:hypothetical protein